jgi:Spy/CpxP family protein refolding chaperone
MIAALLLASVATLVSQADPAETAGGGVAQPVKEKTICRREGRSESRMQRRVCRTAAEWQRIDDADHSPKGGSPDGIGPIGGK